MKCTFLFCASLFFSVMGFGQSAKFNPNGNADKNKLTVTLLKTNLFVTDKDQLVPVASLGALDSLIKKLPNRESLSIHLETENADPEKIKAVRAILNKCNCPITKRSISFNKQ